MSKKKDTSDGINIRGEAGLHTDGETDKHVHLNSSGVTTVLTLVVLFVAQLTAFSNFVKLEVGCVDCVL